MKVKLNSTFQREEADLALQAIGAFESPYTDAELKLGSTVLVHPAELVPDFEDALLQRIGSLHQKGEPTVAVHSLLRNLRKVVMP